MTCLFIPFFLETELRVVEKCVKKLLLIQSTCENKTRSIYIHGQYLADAIQVTQTET